MVELVDVLAEVVAPAVRATFRPGEVSAVQVGFSSEGEGWVDLTLTAVGEDFHDYVVQGGHDDMTWSDWSERLRSNLVDFVAESRFGWGQNRDLG